MPEGECSSPPVAGRLDRPKTPLSHLEATALVQLQMGTPLPAKYREAVRRLVHVGLVAETPEGTRLTKAGETRFLIEIDKLGLSFNRKRP
jgi:hypothetical protein